MTDYEAKDITLRDLRRYVLCCKLAGEWRVLNRTSDYNDVSRNFGVIAEKFDPIIVDIHHKVTVISRRIGYVNEPLPDDFPLHLLDWRNAEK